MKKIIENIRNKPDHHRERIVWILIAIFAGILFIAWLVVGNGHKNNNDTSFFQTFNKGVEESKDDFPDLNTSNSNNQP